jgi:uncharacterized protein HemY
MGGLPADESIALAEPPLMRALELDADLVEAQASLGLLRVLQGDIEAAEGAFDKAIAMRPNYPQVFRLYGKLRYQQDRNDEAIQFLEKAFALDPYSAAVNFDVGRLYEESGRFEEAMEHFLRVVEIEPKHAFAYVYIAAIHYLAYGRVPTSKSTTRTVRDPGSIKHWNSAPKHSGLSGVARCSTSTSVTKLPRKRMHAHCCSTIRGTGAHCAYCATPILQQAVMRLPDHGMPGRTAS